LPEEVTKALPRLDQIVRKALAKDASERYPDMKELVGDLRELKEEVTGKMRPLLKWSLMAASLVLMVVLLVGNWWFAQRGPPVPPQELQPVSVLIADFENQTGDAVFDGALEPTLKIGLEGAPFITTYNRGQALRIAGQIRPGAGSLDEELARLVAQREGINVIVVSSITRQGEGYGISLRAIDAITGESIASEETEAETGEDILAAIAKLAVGARTALGDTTPEAVQLEAAETFTAASLEAARSYALAQEFQGQGKWEEAIPHYSRSVELDPGLGRGYAGLAVMYRNVGEIEEAEKYYQMAMANIDRMTDREKYRTRGGYYVTSRDFEHAIEEYRALVDQYPADFVGHSNLALSYFYGRDMRGAFEEQQRALEIYPQNVVLRTNLALYAMYSGDFETAEGEAQAVLEEFPSYELVLVCVALSQLGQERISDAAATYQRLQGVSTRGVSIAASGLADLALYQGRLEDAIQILEKGIALDDAVGILQQGLTESPAAITAARKAAALGEAHLARGQVESALAAAQQAVALSREENVLFLAARLYLEGGRENQALQLASELSSGLQPESQAYAKLIEGGVELKHGRVQDAIRLFREAQNLADTWLGRLELGRAYVEAGAYTEAYSELESALKRRGEATAVFLDDIPTYRYLPAVYYYLGRAQEGLNSPAAAESYQTFLDIKENSDQDPLVTDARKRLETR